MNTTEKPSIGLGLLREPFAANQISKLPKGGVMLSYVGHAALTDRLLDVDPRWTWEPVANPEAQGLPIAPNGMWIRLTVLGVTRLGYGDAGTKKGGDAVKEIIGDALRNAAMRFGAALDLWHKGQLHEDTETPEPAPALVAPAGYADWLLDFEASADNGMAALAEAWQKATPDHRTYANTTDPGLKDRLKSKAAKVAA